MLLFTSRIQGKCDYVECKYTEWTNWNPACGKNMERKRTLQTIKKTVEKESCTGLTTTCTGDAEQTEKKDDLCKYQQVSSSPFPSILNSVLFCWQRWLAGNCQLIGQPWFLENVECRRLDSEAGRPNIVRQRQERPVFNASEPSMNCASCLLTIIYFFFHSN